MKALRLRHIGDIRLEDVSEPAASEDSILLDVHFCALCRTDAKMWSAGHRDLVLPRILGHEICACDPVTNEYFAVWPGNACGTCPSCRDDKENLCSSMKVLGFHVDGGLAEKIWVSKRSLIHTSTKILPELICLAEPLGCGINAIEQLRLKPGQELLIFGAGPVGLLAALAASTRGIKPFIVEINEKRINQSKKFLLETGIQADCHPRNKVFDAALNAAPDPQTLLQGINLLRPGGSFCIFSGLTGKQKFPSDWINEIHYRQLSVTGAYGCTKRNMESAVELLEKHACEATQLVEKIITPNFVAESFQSILAGKSLKHIVTFET